MSCRMLTGRWSRRLRVTSAQRINTGGGESLTVGISYADQLGLPGFVEAGDAELRAAVVRWIEAVSHAVGGHKVLAAEIGVPEPRLTQALLGCGRYVVALSWLPAIMRCAERVGMDDALWAAVTAWARPARVRRLVCVEALAAEAVMK